LSVLVTQSLKASQRDPRAGAKEVVVMVAKSAGPEAKEVIPSSCNYTTVMNS
jgi:hypothetical protein